MSGLMSGAAPLRIPTRIGTFRPIDGDVVIERHDGAALTG